MAHAVLSRQCLRILFERIDRYIPEIVAVMGDDWFEVDVRYGGLPALQLFLHDRRSIPPTMLIARSCAETKFPRA